MPKNPISLLVENNPSSILPGHDKFACNKYKEDCK